MSTERLLQSIGKRIFVDYYHEFTSNNITKEELAERLLRENKKAKKLGGQFTRNNCAKRIFNENRQLEAIDIILSSKHLDIRTVKKAKLLLEWEKRMQENGIPERLPAYNYNVFSNVYSILNDIVYYYIAYKELHNEYQKMKGDREVWVYTCDAYFQMAFLKWCNVFGTDKNDTHWKKIGFDVNDFKNILLSKINIGEEEWSSYREAVKDFRNNYIAHSHIGGYKYPVPKFDIALKAVLFLDEWLREQIVPDFADDQLLKDLMEQYRVTIRKTFKRAKRFGLIKLK